MDSSLYSKASTFYDIDDIPLIDDEVIEEICSINYKNNQATETKGKNTKNGSRKYSEKRFVVTKLEDNVLNLKNNIDIENLEKGNFDIMKDSLLKMNSNNISPLLNDFVTDDSNNSEECNDDIDKPYEFQLFKKKILVRNPWVLFKKDFIRRRGVEEKQFGLEVVRACLPQLILIVTLLFYIAFGVYVFQNYDEKITNEETRNVVLFVFTTIATIGYGNLSPSSQIFRNIGESCAKFIWLLRASLSTDPNYKPKCIVSLPIQVIMIFLLLHTALGLFLFHYWIDTINYVDAVYMSFISITTIGYGDITPKPTTDLQTFIVLIYLSIGISIMSMMISTLSEMMKIVHVVGRSPAKAKDALIYINGEHITVGTLLQMIAKQFGVHPRELQSVIKNLDHIITAALEEEKRKEKKQRRRRFSLPHFDKNKRQKSQSIESEETQFDSLNFITLTSSNYNPQTCKYIQALGQLNHITQQSDKSRNNTIVLQKNFNSMAKRRNSYHNITKTKYKDDPVSVKLFNE